MREFGPYLVLELIIFAIYLRPVECLSYQLAELPIWRGIPPHRIELYKSRLLNSTTREWRCFTASSPDVKAFLNDDYCDCDDGSDEPGTSACAGIPAVRAQYTIFLDEEVEKVRLPALYSDGSLSATLFPRNHQLQLPNPGFWCQQKGFLSIYVPSWKVNDMICDCCDGADETPSAACPNTCGVEMKEHERRLSSHIAEEVELMQLGEARYLEGLAQLAEWDDLMVNGSGRIKVAEEALRALEAENELRNEQETLSLDEHMSEHDNDEVDEEEWVEEWNEDGSIKRVKKISDHLQKEPTDEVSQAKSITHSLYTTVFDYLQRGLRLVRSLASKGPEVVSPPANVIMQDSLSAKRREVQTLKDEYNRAQTRANNAIFREFPQLVSWADKSLTWRTGEMTYTVNIFGSAFSRQNWDKRLDLGTFSKIVPRAQFQLETNWPDATIGRSVAAPWALFYENGDDCFPEKASANGEPSRIQSLVFLICAREDQLLTWEEQEPCRWTATIATPAFCNVLTAEQKHPTVTKKRDEL